MVQLSLSSLCIAYKFKAGSYGERNTGVPEKRHGGRARVLIFVTAILCEAWALAEHTFMELGERQ